MKPKLPADWGFYLCLSILGGVYAVLIGAMVVADLFFTTPDHLLSALNSPQIRYAIMLSLISCTMTAILSLWVGVPMGYLFARTNFRGKTASTHFLTCRSCLPPLVIGLSLLILFQSWPGRFFQENVFAVTFQVPSVILAQFSVSAAFAVRTMRVTFEQISPRTEQVALTLGCTRAQAFWRSRLARSAARPVDGGNPVVGAALGEFGPILIFAGATRSAHRGPFDDGLARILGRQSRSRHRGVPA